MKNKEVNQNSIRLTAKVEVNMADVTFGVKVPEELKNELSEIMKTTDLTGKEFMSMLLSTYKLEQSKVKKDFLSRDIDELQRLLQRVQSLYLNIGERAELFLEEKTREKDEEIRGKEEVASELTDKINTLVQVVEEREKRIKELEKELHKKAELEKALGVQLEEHKKQLEEQKEQMKENRLLSQKYMEEIEKLKTKVEMMERFELEIAERNEECERLKGRSDTLASDLWFAQREVEKVTEEREKNIKQHAEETKRLEENYKLQMENQLLQQKLLFTNQIEKLKEEYYTLKEMHGIQMNGYEAKLKEFKEEKQEKTR